MPRQSAVDGSVEPLLLSDWRVLLRRWYVTLFGATATLFLCVLAANLFPVQHQVEANVLLLPPKPTSSAPGGPQPNPYLSLGGLEGMGDVVARALSDRAMDEALEQRGFRGDYLIQRDQTSAAPLLLITVEDVSPSTALNTLDYLLGRIPTTLTRIQESSDITSSALISSSTLTRATETEVIRKSQIRALVVALAAGLAGTYLAAALLDGYLRTKRRRVGPTGTPEASILQPHSAPKRDIPA